jgi:hypothetical protein
MRPDHRNEGDVDAIEAKLFGEQAKRDAHFRAGDMRCYVEACSVVDVLHLRLVVIRDRKKSRVATTATDDQRLEQAARVRTRLLDQRLQLLKAGRMTTGARKAQSIADFDEQLRAAEATVLRCMYQRDAALTTATRRLPRAAD